VTHDELVEIGAHIAQVQFGYPWVLREFVARGLHEVPDIFARKPGHYSLVFEVKVSRGDFKRDALKDRRVGELRAMLTPPGLVKRKEVPAGWGLIEAASRDEFNVIKFSRQWPTDKGRELDLLSAAIGLVSLSELPLIRRQNKRLRQGGKIRNASARTSEIDDWYRRCEAVINHEMRAVDVVNAAGDHPWGSMTAARKEFEHAVSRGKIKARKVPFKRPQLYAPTESG
jgi:hypothetical protein